MSSLVAPNPQPNGPIQYSHMWTCCYDDLMVSEALTFSGSPIIHPRDRLPLFNEEIPRVEYNPEPQSIFDQIRGPTDDSIRPVAKFMGVLKDPAEGTFRRGVGVDMWWPYVAFEPKSGRCVNTCPRDDWPSNHAPLAI
ncbi:unnamed protein product [Vitrella brassicaformis CCMP3155]|uniref:Uncharacterized protein n=1 Tax=Vitrella brassicaformis (strain CCMP3155) TaxID=1169540 RepID=A0A0G4EFQ4_VITBC|nr:unnamed protein product [Vitrella brassicaformis CCMP3155]|eukprot:CEL94562.1 unnamed protein product [Vitrella brassicaformis CCMP3155]